jgi:hypothetical protein
MPVTRRNKPLPIVAKSARVPAWTVTETHDEAIPGWRSRAKPCSIGAIDIIARRTVTCYQTTSAGSC